MAEPSEDRLRHELDRAAARIDIGDTTAGLDSIHSDVRRRRRRRTAGLAMLGVITAAAVAGVLAVAGDPEVDRISSADPTTSASARTTTTTPPTTTAAAAAATPSSTTASSGDADPATAPEDASTPRVVRAAAGAAVEVPGLLGEANTGAAGGGFVEWLVPWNGGFLAGTTEVIQPRPEPLSEELRSRFPQEVNDLFADGLPPTINEAQDILAEAGLLDEVTEIVLADQELYDALYAATPDVRLTVGTSDDGETWSPVELTLPAGMTRPDQVTSTGDRLVIVGHRELTEGDPAAGSEEIIVASTTDLATWEVVSIPTHVPASVPAPLAKVYGWNQIAVNDRGWVLDVGDGLTVEAEQLVADLGIDDGADSGYETEVTSDPPGVAVRVYTADGEVLAERVVTWDEIGIEESMQAQFAKLIDPDRAARWTGTWGGGAVESASVRPGYEVAALGSGFLELGEQVRFSTDGRAWEPVAAAPPRQWVSGVLPTESGAVVLTQDRGGAGHAYLVDDTASSWEEISIEGAPPALQPFQSGSQASAIVVNGASQVGHETTVVIDGDGGQLTITTAATERSYRLFDPAGEVLAEESIDVLATDDFEHLSYGEDGDITVVDATTGDPLFTASEDQVRVAHTEAFAEEGPEAYPAEDLWLLATSDGERWLVHDLPDPTPSGDGWWPGPAAVNGDTVLLAANDGWLRFDLPT